jgi:guanylate kinase
MEEFMRIDDAFEAILLLPPSFDIWNERIDGRGDMTHDNKLRRFQTAITEYSVVFNNERFYPVINTEVVEAAEVIRTGAYKDPAYRQQALLVAQALRGATQAFLDAHQN